MASITAAGRAGKKVARRPTTDKDVFLDVVVLISVVIFVILATGVGVLALQMSLH